MKLSSNIWKMYVIRALRWFMLIMPVVIIFFQDNGLSMKEIMILQSVFSISIVVLEVPSGYFADRMGRKTTLIIGSIFGALGFLAHSLSYGFWAFMIGEISMGIGASFISGSDSALIYDSLLELGRESDYQRIEGRYTAIGNFSEGTAAVIGALLAGVFLRLPLYIETGLMFLAIPLVLTLVEPKRHSTTKKQNILAIARFSLIEHKEVKWLILYSALIGASTLTMVFFIQPYLTLSGLPLAWFGVVWAILQFSTGLFSWIAHHLEKRWGKKVSLIMLIPLSPNVYVI